MILAIDIGGTNIKYGLIDQTRKIKDKGSIPTESKSYKELIDKLTSLSYNFENLEGIAISVPGTLKKDGTSTGISALPYILNQNILKDIEEATNLKTIIENDANCSVVSELWENSDAKSIAAIAIGTGVGGAIIIDGNLYKGYRRSAGEFGLLINFDEDNKVQQIPQSAVQMTNEFNKQFKRNISTIDIFNEYNNGDLNAIKSIDKFFNKLSTLVFNLEFMINPELIVFSGGITNQDKFLELLLKSYNELKDNNKDMFESPSKIKVSKYKSDAQLVGLAYIWYKGKTYERN